MLTDAPMNDLRARVGTQSAIGDDDESAGYPTVWQASEEVW